MHTTPHYSASAGASVFRLDGKVAIVTGATKGIGRAMAEGLAAAGASVVVSSRKQDLCEQAAAEITAATGSRALPLACHVGEWDAIPGFVARVADELGRIDVLVNNAGITPSRLTVSEIDLEVWRKIFNVNLEGPLRMAQCVAPVMRDQGGGSIINISSMGAYSGGGGVCAYAASKAALINLTRTMASEWAPWGIRVNAVSPGPFVTEMVKGAQRFDPDFTNRIGTATLMQRVADPAEIIGPVLYLASDASSYVTGDDITVAGGMRR